MNPDWRAIASAIGAAENTSFAATQIDTVVGGSIHSAWLVGDGQRRYFVKTGGPGARPMFDAEAAGLAALAAAEAVRTPRVVTRGESSSTAFLVLEALTLEPLKAQAATRLGEALAQLHRQQGKAYGWPDDNFIGLSVQRNAPHESWPHFYADRRLRPQLALARDNGMEASWVAKGIEIAERVGALFLDYRPAPSLLHGDLWSGNAGQSADGTPVVFDPACHWGDREADIAMAELFGGFPTSFFVAYRRAWPLHPDYERRKPLYTLYHILNHYNMFGAAYLGQAQRMIAGLLAQLKR